MTAPPDRSPTSLPRWVPPARRLAHLLLRLLLRLRVHGLEHLPASGPVLLAGNHTGFLDGPVVFVVAPRPSIFMIKSELYAGRLGRFLHHMNQVPVHRGTPDRTALRRGLTVLAAGGVLGMFPEGTRGSGGLVSIQHGIGYLALRGGAPVVPVACLGTAEALPRGRRLPRLRTPVDIVFGPAFTLRRDGDPVARRTVATAAEQVRLALRAHLEQAAAATGHPLPEQVGE